MKIHSFCENYLFFIITSLFLGTILNDYRVLNTIFYFVLFLCLSYFVHFMVHYMYIPFFTDIHNGHHTKEKKDTFINIISEVFIELFSTGGFLLLFDIPYFSKSLIIYYPLLYTTIHFINYRFYKEYHAEHHKNTSVNYGPSIMDHLLGTNYDDSFENMNDHIVNCIVIFVVLFFIKTLIQS